MPYDHHPESITSFSSLTPQPIPWLWPNRLPLSQISLLVSRPGQGKSLLTTDLAARISTGSPWPDGSPNQKGSVILIPREDNPAQVILPRLRAQGADLSKIYLLTDLLDLPKSTPTPELHFNLEHFGQLQDALNTLPDCKLVIFDPIAAYFSGCDINHDSTVRKSLNALFHLAQRHGPAVLLVHHLKSRPSAYADQRILGGQAFTTLSRNIWHLLRDPENKKRRLLLPGKSNYAPEAQGLAFTIESASPLSRNAPMDNFAAAVGPRASFPSSGTPGEGKGGGSFPEDRTSTIPRILWEKLPLLLNADEAPATHHGPIPIERQAAQSWLKSLLTPGPLDAREVHKETQTAGLIWRTVQRAADHLKIERTRGFAPGQWFWKLPDSQS